MLSDCLRTALLLIDPYNDFISEGGKAWERLHGVASRNGCVPHMQQVLQAARRSGVRVCYSLHRRYHDGDYESWQYLAPTQREAWRLQMFAAGSWGGRVRSGFEPRPGDIVAQEHRCSNCFANTDLDLQLRQHGIEHIVVAGLLVNACVESTVRDAAERGYRVTVVRDATAGFSAAAMQAALDIDLPQYASDIVTTQHVVDALASSRP